MDEHQLLHIFDTEQKKKLPIAFSKNPLKIYTCGPTVYDYAHIGNFRTYVFEDVFIKTVKYLGFQTKHVMNITDIDDKTIKKAVSLQKPLNSIAKKYTDAFFTDLYTLNIQKADSYPRATNFVPQMIAIIVDLMQKGIAYKGKDGSIYFSISHFPSYGRLSHLCLDDLKTGASNRQVMDEYDKDSAQDFVLWKAYDENRDGDIFWESPFGKGRPGWHMECSAMAIHELGPSIDIHMGGVDNIFPHHENEIAQSEAHTCKHFVKHWVHAEHLLVENKKMSKSLGNFYTLRDLIGKGFTGIEVRYLLMQTHYRTQLNFTLEGLSSAKKSLQRFQDFILRMKEAKGESSNFASSIIKKTKVEFKKALCDDLNMSVALAALFDMMRDVNNLFDACKISSKDGEDILSFLKECNQVLSVLSFDDMNIPQDVLDALEQRNIAKKEKNYTRSDELRDFIFSKGYIIEDTKEGSRLKLV